MHTILLHALFLAAPALGATETPSLAGALESVQAENLRVDVHFIASDDLAGRDTPSDELRVAARFLQKRLERLGWHPGAEDGWFHTYPLLQNRLDEEASHVELVRGGDAVHLAPGTDYVFQSQLDLGDLDASGEVVYCGAGSEEELDGIELEGRWALCTEGKDHVRVLRTRARRAGACGLVLARGANEAPFEERFASIWDGLTRAKVRFPGPERASREVFPLVLLTDAGLERLTRLAGLDAPREDGLPGLALEPGTALDVRMTEARRRAGPLSVENVCGYWPGSDPELAREVILVSAHYDHVGVQDGEVYNGADDNGSGTCGLLALAEALTKYGPMRRSVMLIWVSGEEKGLWGSKAWVQSGGWLPETESGPSRAIANVNIDMIGRNDPDALLVTPTKAREDDYNGIVKRIERLAPLEGFTDLGSADRYYHRSDQAEFAKLGIPVSFVFADVHEDYHRPGDTPEKLDYDKIRRVVRLVLRVLDSMQDDELDL